MAGSFAPRGWVKSYRKMARSRVWRHHNAARAFQALLWDAASVDTPCALGNGVAVLRRGQVFTRHQTFAAENYFSVDQVRRAFDVLKDLGMIECEGGRHGVLVTILAYEEYQSGDSDGEKSRREARPESARETAGNTAAKAPRATPSKEKGIVKPDAEDRREARRKSAAETAGNTAAPYRGYKKIRNNNNPPTPFLKKGGRGSFDFASPEKVLAMWREERAAAGLAAVDGKRSIRAAKILTGFLAGAQMSADSLRGGMKALLRDIAGDPRRNLFDLLTLANNPERYCTGPVVVRGKKRRVIWEFVCDVCGNTACSPAADADAGAPDGQACGVRGCQGTMLPVTAHEL